MHKEQASSKVSVILCHESSVLAYSIFNPNDWNGASKAIIHSCAVQQGILLYEASKLKAIFQQADALCLPRFADLESQWNTAKWEINTFSYFVEIPEAHLSIQAFLGSIKIFFDIIVQLISAQGIVSQQIHGFHKKGDDVGGKLMNALRNNAKKETQEIAVKLDDLIARHKAMWIDQAVKARDIFIHPGKGFSSVMFALDLQVDEGKLRLVRVIKPSINDEDFDRYAEKTTGYVANFSEQFLSLIKNV
ncbi:MAG: hypothetical protein FJ266_01065 [Planctomycetes bacterium]|nr:hypothetical protein [Planctomycetota bacterium]